MPFRHIIIDSDNPTYPHCKAVGDIDGDGFADVLAASAYGQGLYWYAYPNWTKHRIAGGSFTTDMQVGDVDKDGDLDVIIPPVGTGLVWFENPRPQGKPATTAWRMHRIDEEDAHDLEVGDVDGDGRLDVVVRHGRTRVFLQNSPDSWRKIAIPTGGRGGTALGDLDGDGDLDIAQDGYWLETPADKSSRMEAARDRGGLARRLRRSHRGHQSRRPHGRAAGPGRDDRPARLVRDHGPEERTVEGARHRR